MTPKPGVHPLVIAAVLVGLFVWAAVVGAAMWSGAWAP